MILKRFNLKRFNTKRFNLKRFNIKRSNIKNLNVLNVVLIFILLSLFFISCSDLNFHPLNPLGVKMDCVTTCLASLSIGKKEIGLHVQGPAMVVFA